MALTVALFVGVAIDPQSWFPFEFPLGVLNRLQA